MEPTDNLGRRWRGVLWLTSYISMSFWIILTENMEISVKFLAFGAINIVFASMIGDDTTKEGP